MGVGSRLVRWRQIAILVLFVLDNEGALCSDLCVIL